jgi:hypothetical protein
MLPSSIGVDKSSEVSWRGVNGPDSGVRRSALCSDGPAVGAGRSAVSTESCVDAEASWRDADHPISFVKRPPYMHKIV